MDSVNALFSRGLVSEDQRVMLAGFCKRWNCSGFEALIETNMISERAFADLASDILRLPRVPDVRGSTLSPDTLALLPFPFARSRGCLVLGMSGPADSRIFRVAIANPWDRETRMMVEDMLHGDVEWFIGERSHIIEAIDRHFPLSSIVPHFWEVLAVKNHD